MKCSECGVENDAVEQRQAQKNIKSPDKRFGKSEVGIGLNKKLCDECWAKWNSH